MSVPEGTPLGILRAGWGHAEESDRQRGCRSRIWGGMHEIGEDPG